MIKNYIFILLIAVTVFLPIATLGSTISTSDYRVELPGDWNTNIENDGVSAFIEKDVAGYYKSFALSLSEEVSEREIKKSHEDFANHFNAIESSDKAVKLVDGNIKYKSKNGLSLNYYILFAGEKNVLSFYALTSIKNKVALISYKVYRVSEGMDYWKEEFISILNSLK